MGVPQTLTIIILPHLHELSYPFTRGSSPVSGSFGGFGSELLVLPTNSNYIGKYFWECRILRITKLAAEAQIVKL